MKLLSNYIKEMKIAARGFYFYIEIIFAILILVILWVGVKEETVSKDKEFLYYDMSDQLENYLIQTDIEEGRLVLIEPTEFKMKALEFEVTSIESDEVESYQFEEDLFTLTTYEHIDLNTGKLDKTLYLLENEEDLIRISYQEKTLGATIAIDDLNDVSYRYFLEGYETQKLVDLIQILHNESRETLEAAFENQQVRKLSTIQTLNNRENLVPIMVVFMGSLMGFFIVMAYIFLDKDEGVIKAFAVTPASVWEYLFSKTLIIITTVIMSSSIIAIPIMGLQPNYLLFYLLLIISTFGFASLGLLIASFFDSISKAFGILYVFMIAMMLPAFSYFIPSFDPLWLRFFPTYPMIQSMREIIMVETDLGYVLTTAVLFLAGGLVLFLISNYRFKKTLTV